MKYILVLIIVILFGCEDKNRPVELTTLERLDSLGKSLDIVISNSKAEQINKRKILKATWSKAWWSGVQSERNHPATIDLAFLYDSLKFAMIVDESFPDN